MTNILFYVQHLQGVGHVFRAARIVRALVAEGFGVDCEIHAPGHAPRHCMAAIRNTNYYELGLVHPKVPGPKSQNAIFADDYSDDLDSVDAQGCVPVPTGPGLGIAIDWKWLAAHETGKVVYE